MTERRIISLVRCPEYDLDSVYAAIRRSIDLLGGVSAFIKPGQRVLLKPNLLRPASQDRGVSTHPTVVAAVAKLVNEAGAHPVIVESPGGPFSPALLKLTYRKTGMLWAAEVGGAELNYSVESVQVSHPKGYVLRRLDLVKPAVEADAVINLPKLKTHNLTKLTVAVKNLFGLVPGLLKMSYHAKLQDARRFSEGLNDIATYVKPTLNIVDAVVAMEGNGPSGGDLRQLGVIIAGVDPFAVDVVSAALVGFDPLSVLTTRMAAARGLTTGRLEDLELVGDPFEALRVTDFRPGAATAIDPGLLPRGLLALAGESDVSAEAAEGQSRPRQGWFGRLAYGWLSRQLVVVPGAGDKCIGCGQCAKSCPVGAIKIVDGKAHMDTRKCIRCYCCHELCPEEAVELHRPWLGRLLIGR